MMAEQEKEPYYFSISLNVLNHLGRGLYRNFITILGEAISNSWDAGAKNVWIDIYKESRCFSIKDDGHGMSETDFRKKFLNVGYSRREDDNARTPEGRPLIGGKGIGKLALLSCAQRIHITSKTSDTEYMGAVIDNRELDEAIDSENKDESKNYKLAELDKSIFENLKRGHEHGTIIYFENTNEGINNNIETLRRLIALYFRFSLVDPSFSIFVNETKIGFGDLDKLSDNTEFLWNINEFTDPFLETLHFKEKVNLDIINKNIKGFIASVEKPIKLNIFGVSEKTGVDVFVNGRLRETNILKHTPSYATRHIASYIYGQIHLDILDDENSGNNEDRFTTSREGIKPEDNLYKDLLETIKDDILAKISNQWDDLRRTHRKDGDPYNEIIPTYQRKLEESKNARDDDFEEKINNSELDDETKASLKETLRDLAKNNTEIYQDLFILENLFRAFLKKRGISDVEVLKKKFPKDADVADCIETIQNRKGERENGMPTHNLHDEIVKENHDLNYLDLMQLGILVDMTKKRKPKKVDPKKPKLQKHEKQTRKADAIEITPVRNAVMHTNEILESVMKWPKIQKTINHMDNLVDKL